VNKEEILEMSRKENKNQDPYEKEIFQNAGNIAAVVAAVLATIFFIIQILVGLGSNYGLYAVVFSVPATGYLVSAMRMKKRWNTLAAIVFIIATMFFSVVHIHQLITTSTIL